MMEDIWMKALTSKNTKIYKWKGCEHCNNTGYKWRIWIYEILSFNDQVRDMIREWATTSEIMSQARKFDFISMKEDGVLKAIKWYTTIEEVLRVI
jgi:type IV pilus assembly protein PilB